MSDFATTTRSGVPSAYRILLAVLLIAASGPILHAQELQPKSNTQSAEPNKEPAPPADDPSTNAPRPAGPIQYVGPDTYILLDAQGRPQPVPGMKYEDFLEAWKKLNASATPDNRPRFTIESIKFDGQTRDDRAELKFEATVRLLTDGSVDVPLGLVGAILQNDARFTNVKQPAKTKGAAALPNSPKPTNKESENEYLDFNPHQGGFVARFVGHSGERHSVSFDLVVPLVRDGADTTLALNCPRSASSSLALSVDLPVNEFRCNTGAVTKKTAAGSSTKVEVTGPSGQFRLSWQAGRKDTAAIASVLNAVGAVHVAIDGRGVRSEARLTVRSFGGSFDQFRVRLPHGAKLLPRETAGETTEAKYRISEEAPAIGAKGKNAAAGQIVLVELKEKQQGPVVVDLSTEQSGHDAGQPVELGGFELLGAVRQYGDIALWVANDWQARWEMGRDIRQVDPTELDPSLQKSDSTAAFQYDGQPWSLAVSIAPRRSRVHVTPQYTLELLPDEARLTAHLNYQTFGARAFKFLVELNGWEMNGDPVEAGGLVNQDRITVSPEGTLTLPLAQASSRKVDVAFTLRRALGRDASKVELPLPVPTADSVGTGELTVRVPPEIELLPDLSNSSGLAVSVSPETANRNAADSSTELRYRLLVPNAVFVANRSNRSRQLSAQVSNQVTVSVDAVQVAQTFDYVVRYEPVKELIFEAAADVPMESEGVDIGLITPAGTNSTLAEQRTPLRFEPVADESALPTSDLRRWRVILPQPQLGKFAVSARYRIPRPQLAPTDGGIQVPLLAAVDCQDVSSRAAVTSAPGISATLNTKTEGSSWKVVDSPKVSGGAAGHEFSSDRAELTLPLAIGASETKAATTTIVDRVWLQTWLANDVEQDRAAFRFRTTGSETTVELPPGAPQNDIEVLLDGRPAEVTSPAPGRIVVRLASKNGAVSESATPATHTLELRFRYLIQQPLVARHRLTPPQIDGTTVLSHVYWQIVLPGDQHIVRAPNQLTSASEWQWLGAFWGRQPVMSQADVESWVGASPQIAPTGSDNQYLFTGLLPVSSIELVTAPRWLIVLVASSAVLALFMGWFYLPIAARPWLLAGLVFAIAAAAVAYPTAALLVAQAAVIGLVLGMLSVIWARIASRPRWRPVPPTMAASSQRMLTPRAESIIMPSVMAAASTAPTVTLRGSESDR